MKVFISWSGERSKTVALYLRQWFPDVINPLEPWMSATDIQAGARWSSEIATKLEDTRFGIICLTKENLTAPWILFEAGALAKTVADTFVCPYLIGLSPADMPTGPLSQFQTKRADKDGTWELMQSLNAAMPEHSLSDDRLIRSFERCWPDLQAKLDALPEAGGQQIPKRPVENIASDTLEVVRELLRRTPQETTSQKYVYTMTIGGGDSDVKEFRNSVSGIEGYLSRHFGARDYTGALEVEITFGRRIDKDILVSMAEEAGLSVLMKPLMHMA